MVKKTTKKVEGDVNNDGIVDEKDLSIVHKGYSKSQKAKKASKKETVEKPKLTHVERLRLGLKKENDGKKK